jgi:hypothetical protein
MVAYPGNIFQARQPFVAYLLPEALPNEERQAMTMTAVARCSECKAVVNVHWTACLVCRTSLSPVLESPPPSHPTPGIHGRIEEPVAPILPGWLVAYRDRQGRLCGGSDDRAHGTVKECRWGGIGWTVHLTDGQQMPLSLIRAVGKTDYTGQILAAWTVREHGADGNGRVL